MPFFLAGLCIALALKTRAERVSRLYFFDLVGAGVGCLIVVFLIPPLTAPGAVVAAGTLVALAGVLFASGEGRGALVVPAVGVVAWRCSESYLYTTEAMGELLDHLTPNGALSIVVGDTAVPSLGFPRHTMRQHSSWRHCTSAASTTPRAASRWWRQPRACPRWT